MLVTSSANPASCSARARSAASPATDTSRARRASNISSRVKPCSAARKLSGSVPNRGGPSATNVPAPGRAWRICIATSV